ncbi:MAG: protein phosphatase 2C domain-containing protein, partial [Myxococcota bacterium]
MKLHSSAYTHIGRRSNNEDTLAHDDALGLFAVADGMGGYEGGEVASQLAIETLFTFVRRNRNDRDVTWPYALDRALSLAENMAVVGTRLAHDQIAHRRHGNLAQMGSTLALLLRHRRDRAIIAHVGDSRIYRLRSGQLTALTVDHSMYEELRRAGETDLPPRQHFPYSNVITRALGISGQADVRTIDLAAGDIYLLCTDGLSDVVDDARIAEILATAAAREACRILVSAAYQGGGRDNITAV